VFDSCVGHGGGACKKAANRSDFGDSDFRNERHMHVAFAMRLSGLGAFSLKLRLQSERNGLCFAPIDRMKTAVWMGIGLGVFVVAGSCLADESFPTLKVGSEVFSNVTVTTVTTTDIYFTHAKGMGNAKLKDLDRAMQQHFHYNATNAAVALQKQRQATAQFRADLITSAATRPAAPQRAIDDSDDFVAPQLTARSFRGGHPPDLVVGQWITSAPDTRGKFVLVDFWATWCGPCRQSIPHLNSLAAQFRNELSIVGLTDESPEVIAKMKTPQIQYFIATDMEARSSRMIGVTAIPHALLLDPNGFVRFEGNPLYLTQERLAGLIRKYSND
jgi:thiol-disulfide isomerase/thioredoxin